KDEETGREPEDGNRKEARGDEKAAIHDAPAAQDAWYVDGQPGSVARALPVVAFDFAPEMTQDERTRRDHEKTEKAETVAEPAADDGAGDEVEESEDDDLLIVGGAAPRGEADDLEGGGEFDRELEDARAGEEAPELHDEESDRCDGREA